MVFTAIISNYKLNDCKGAIEYTETEIKRYKNTETVICSTFIVSFLIGTYVIMYGVVPLLYK